MMTGLAPSLTTSSTSLAPPTGPAPPESKAAPGTGQPCVSGTPSLPRPSTLQLAFTIYALFGVDRVCAGTPTIIDVVGDMLDAGVKNVVIGGFNSKESREGAIVRQVAQAFAQNAHPSLDDGFDYFNVHLHNEEAGPASFDIYNGSSVEVRMFHVDSRQADTFNWQKLMKHRDKPSMMTMSIQQALGSSPYPGRFVFGWMPTIGNPNLQKMMNGNVNARLDVFATLQRTAPSMYTMTNDNIDTPPIV